jgi:polyvinyl alcohol dehydrogenase (cytochrome)
MNARVFRVLPAVLVLVASISAIPARALAVQCAPARPIGGGGDWPQFGQNIRSDRNQTGEHYLDASNAPLLQPAWTFDANRWTHATNNEITSYPVEADGCVFVGSSVGNDAQGQHLPGWIFAMNADNGDVVWEQQVRGAAYSTLAVSDGVVYAFVSVVSAPYVVAFDEFTGAKLWETVVDEQPGSDAVSSPVVYDGLVWVGISGTNAEGSAADRPGFEGSTVLLAAKTIEAPEFRPLDAGAPTGAVKTYRPGEIVRKLYSIPPSEWKQGYAGGSQWGTIAIDPETGYGYEGTGNPFNYDFEHAHTNAILKIDLDRARDSFGRITASYKGDIEQGAQEAAGVVPCHEAEQIAGFFGAGFECVHLDLDFGATPNIIRDANGRKLIVEGQKSGVVHFVDADTMAPVAKLRLGIPSAVGGMVGSGATDGTLVFGSHTVGGYLYAVDAAATPKWVTPTADGVHWGPPVSMANHVIYVVDLKGFLDAYDSGTGAPLLHRPLQLPGVEASLAPSARLTGDPATIENPPLSWGGTTIARNTVYVSTGVGLSQGLPNGAGSLPDGFVIAFRPAAVPR